MDYIERDAAKEAVDASILHDGIRDALKSCIDDIPAADVRPMVRGKWEAGGMFDDIGRCSCCHYMFPLDTAMTEFHYCPNCGADMRETKE